MDRDFDDHLTLRRQRSVVNKILVYVLLDVVAMDRAYGKITKFIIH